MIGAVYPPRCSICEDILENSDIGICKTCFGKLEYISEPVCKQCGKPIFDDTAEFCYDCGRKKHFFLQNKGVFVYRGEMQKSIYRFKYNNKREYGQFYANEIIRAYGDWIKTISPDYLIPIPIYKTKKRTRGFNQSELIADLIGKNLDIPVLNNYLVRVKKTVPQKELNDLERKNNIKNAFKLNKNIVKLRKAILIDDIYTTGSTIDEAARLLADEDIEVYSLTLCIGKGD